MEFRDLGERRAVRRPAVDHDRLSTEPAELAGDVDHELVRFDGGAQREVHGRGSVSEAVLVGVDLTGARLQPLSLADVVFEQVELSGAVLHAVPARRVELLRCRAMGLRLSFTQVADVYLEGCRLDYATVHLERVTGRVAFRDCTFREATVGGDLSDVVFDGCDFAAAELRATAAKGCDLRTSRLVGARGLLSLRGATVTTEQVVSVADQLAAEAGLVVAGR